MKIKTAFLTCLLGANLSAIAYSQEAVSTVSIVENGAAEARQTPDLINLLHQRSWVKLDEVGNLNGTLSVLTLEGQLEGRIGATVVISRDGKVVLETETDTDGVFKLEGLKPGTYGLQSRGDYTFAACALHVLPANAEHLTSELEIYASVIPAERALELISSGLVPADLSPVGDVYYREFASDPLKGERKFNDSHKVVLQERTLVGRVSRPGWTFAEQDLTGSVAQVVRDGVVIAKAAVAKDGYYQVENFEPGVYDLFVSGDDGFAVMAFEAIAADETVAAVSTDGARLVTTQSGTASNCLSCEMIYQPEVSACTNCGGSPIAQGGAVDQFGAPVAGGGFAGPGGFGGGGGGFGGGGGGGFGGGGIGGLGGLLGIAGLAVGIAALADDDDAGQGTPITP